MPTGSLTDHLRETLALFEHAGEPQTTPEVADRLDLGRRSTYERLNRLVEHGRLETKKVGANARVWWRPATAADATAPDRPAVAESLVEDAFDRISDGFFDLDGDDQFNYVNDRAAELLDLSKPDVLGSHVGDELDLTDTFERSLVEAVEEGRPVSFEEYDDSLERWFENTVYPSETGVSVYLRDVTERKERERELRCKERRYEAVFEDPDMLVGLLEPDGTVLNINETAMEYIDADLADVAGESFWETPWWGGDEELRTDVRAWVERAAAGEYVDFEADLTRSDGQQYTISGYFRPVTDDDGEVVSIIVSDRDITERKQRERELARYETLFEESKDVNVIVDSNGRFQYLTPSAANVFGYDPEELVGEVGFEYVHPDDREETMIEFAKMIETSDYEPKIEYRFERKDGSWIVLEALARDLRDDPDIEGVVIYTRDITERKQREQEFERYAGIMDAVGEPVYELDAAGQFTFVNEAFVEQLGFEESELLGEHVSVGMDEAAIERAEACIQDLLEDDSEATATLEYEVETADGERIPVENRISILTDEAGRVRGSAGVLWDLTERKERERALEESRRRYGTLVNNFPNGMVMLFDADMQCLTVGGELYQGLGVSPAELEGNRIPEHIPSELLEAIEPAFRAVFDGETSEFDVEFNDQIRHVQVIPVSDESGSVFAGMAMSQDVTERVERKRTLERQREQLSALDNLNEVVRNITEAVIEQSTREEIEATVCERLAEVDSYEFAWIAEVDPQTLSFTPHVEAGVDGYLEDISLSMDPDEPVGRGPGGRAVRTREIQTVQDALTDPDFEPWREHAKAYGYRSAAAIPIVSGKTLYGLLGVYADRPKAFESQEEEVIGQLGEVVGHAIAAIERKRALMSDEVTEIEFGAPGIFDTLGVDLEMDGTITVDQAVPIGDGSFLEYGTADEGAIETLDALVDQHPEIEDVTVFEGRAETTRFELRTCSPTFMSIVASHGGYIQQAKIDEDGLHATVHLPPTVAVRRVADAVRETYPTTKLLRRQQITRDETVGRVHQEVMADLTDRQRATLEAAVYSGFFEWPRESTGEDVARALGIAPPTFSQHLRKAQQKVFQSLFPSSTPA